MPEFCLVDKQDHVMTVTLNRPDRLNALHPPANAELGQVFDEFANDDDLWVAVITGSGRGFSAGNDLRYQAEGGKRVPMPRGFGGITSRFDLTKPVIAAVNGVAMGGGFEIALACDIIIASEAATFALPEPRVGLAALAGGLHRLPRAIGTKRAMGMILTGRRPAGVGLDPGHGRLKAHVHAMLGRHRDERPGHGVQAAAREVDARHTVQVGDDRVQGKSFLRRHTGVQCLK
jgi:enoyl-CoA hydratase/carnithine racemase